MASGIAKYLFKATTATKEEKGSGSSKGEEDGEAAVDPEDEEYKIITCTVNPKEVEEKIGLHRLARSNGVARNANVVIQIESRPQEQSYPDSYYWIIKNRMS
mgnify:CR=1 FL=1